MITPFEDANRKAVEFCANMMIAATIIDLVDRVKDIETAKKRLDDAAEVPADLIGLTDAINADYIRIDEALGAAAIGLAQAQGIEA